MSILFRDDPSFYNASQIAARYSIIGTAGLLTVPATAGRWGGPCWQFTINGNTCLAQSPVLANTTTMTIGVDFMVTALPSGGSVQILSFYDSGTTQVDLRMTTSQQLQFTRNGASIGPLSTNTIVANTWYRLEAQVTFNGSAGSVEARIAGSSTGWVPATGSLNTKNTANSSANQAVLGVVTGSAFVTYKQGNIVVTDSNSPNAGFLGDKRIFLMLPSSNSSVAWTPTFAAFTGSLAMVVGQQIKDSNGNVQRVTIAGTTAGSAPSWATTGGVTTTSGSVTFTVVGSGANPGATNWMAVSETPADGDSSYNASSNPTDIDLFGLSPALAVTTQNIAEAGAVLYARKDDAGVRSIASLRKSSTSTATGSTVALNSTYGFIDQIVEVDPNTSSAWTVSGVNASLVGYDEIA